MFDESFVLTLKLVDSSDTALLSKRQECNGTVCTILHVQLNRWPSLSSYVMFLRLVGLGEDCLADSHVDPGSHVVGLELQSFLVGVYGFRAAAAVCKGGAKFVPQAVVGAPSLKGLAEGVHRSIIVARQIAEDPQGYVSIC